MAKILVTGSSGFIGRHLVKKLQSDQINVLEITSSSGDIASEFTWSRLEKAEAVVHLAGRTYVPDSWKDPVGFLRTNLIGTICALDYCRKHNARLVFVSSYIYGKPKELPISESAALEANNPYSFSKKLAEDACAFYANNFGVKITILRPFNVYGLGQGKNFLIPSIINQIADSKYIRVNDLEPKRDYIYICDLVDVIGKALELDNNFEIFNVGTGVSYSVSDLIELVQQISGTKLTVQSIGERRPEEIMDTKADITKASEILGWKPKWTLVSGLKNMLS